MGRKMSEYQVKNIFFAFIAFILISSSLMLFSSYYVNADLIGQNTTVTSRVNVTNAPPDITNITIDDPIDLIANFTKTVLCNVTVRDYNGVADIANVNATLFDATFSSLISADHPRTHYTNESCIQDSAIDAVTALYTCSYEVYYYANPGIWTCHAFANDTFGVSSNYAENTTINTLIALMTPELIDYGDLPVLDISANVEANVTNVGNTEINLTLYGYNNTPSDGLAMGCEQGNISYVNQRYSLSDDAWASMNILNNTNPTLVPGLIINHRNNTIDESINTTHWKLYISELGIPYGVCTGQIIFGAVQAYT
jgi:hypothetical protein